MLFLDVPERGNAASLTGKLDCVTALWPRGGSWRKHGVGDSKAPAVENFAWLPVGINYNKPARGSVSLS